MELKPSYLKFDISIVRGVHKNLLKQEMIKMLSLFAEKINAMVIAEGIENKSDLKILQKMGLELGQGFYFSKPLGSDQLKTEYKL